MKKTYRKLGADDILAIHRIYLNLDELTQHELAKLFNVSQSHISRILAGQRRRMLQKSIVE